VFFTFVAERRKKAGLREVIARVIIYF